MTLNLNDPTLLKTQAYINAEWVNGDRGETLPVYNPASGAEIAAVAHCGAAETVRAITYAEAAMKGWQWKPTRVRSTVLRRWYDLIVANQEDLAIIMTTEQGKVLSESRGEVAYAASFIEWFSEEAKRVKSSLYTGSPGQDHTLIHKAESIDREMI